MPLLKAKVKEFNDGQHYYTGEKNKELLVHIMQDNVEIDKPVKTQIWKQQVEWRERVYPISHQDFIIDSKGLHHQYVTANETRTLRFGANEVIDKCTKCGGQIGVDAKNIRELTKRNTIQAIWGIDSTHVILLMILGIAVVVAMGFGVYEQSQQQALQAKIDSALSSGSLKALAPTPQESQTVTSTQGVTK